VAPSVWGSVSAYLRADLRTIVTIILVVAIYFLIPMDRTMTTGTVIGLIIGGLVGIVVRGVLGAIKTGRERPGTGGLTSQVAEPSEIGAVYR
jgi:hypothetical protein